jgi:hypothetical protein
MRQNEIADALQSRPFRPFRIHVSSGNVHEVRHPELVHLTRRSALICTPVEDQPPTYIERLNLVDFLHITEIEYTESPASTDNE